MFLQTLRLRGPLKIAISNLHHHICIFTCTVNPTKKKIVNEKNAFIASGRLDKIPYVFML